MKLVLDTNILISALLTKGTAPDQLYQAWKVGDFDLVTSDRQLDELQRVLGYEKLRPYIKPHEAANLLANIDTQSEILSNIQPVEYSRDPDDNWIIATAIQGKADYIVSGDKRDMLSLGEIEGIQILNTSAAAQMLSEW